MTADRKPDRSHLPDWVRLSLENPVTASPTTANLPKGPTPVEELTITGRSLRDLSGEPWMKPIVVYDGSAGPPNKSGDSSNSTD